MKVELTEREALLLVSSVTVASHYDSRSRNDIILESAVEKLLDSLRETFMADPELYEEIASEYEALRRFDR